MRSKSTSKIAAGLFRQIIDEVSTGKSSKPSAIGQMTEQTNRCPRTHSTERNLKRGLILGSGIALATLCWSGGASGSLADSTLKRNSSWNWPDNSQVITDLDRYLSGKTKKTSVPPGSSQQSSSNQQPSSPTQSTTDAAGVASVPPSNVAPAEGATLSALSNADLQSIRGWGLVERLVQILSQHEPAIASLVKKSEGGITSSTHTQLEADLDAVLSNGGIPDRLKADMQLWVCRSFVQNALYDEAIERLEKLPLESVSDPATLLFNLAVCQHHLLRKDECLATLQKLLERELDLPTRYAVTARLMEADIKPLEEDSLDEISRIMNDVERRLTLGRTGKIVQDKQQSIVDKLDKSIDKFEQQLRDQQQQQKQQQQQQQKQQQSKDANGVPMDQKFSEVKGDGEVDPKDLGNGSGWGNLPPAQRQEALQNMTKDLPSHYRDVIEAYFKRLATTKD